MRRLLLALFVLFLPLQADARGLESDISSDEIAITSRFAGTELLLFGSKGPAALSEDEELDVIVVIHGPEIPMKIWRKERVAGIWVNSAPVEFDNVPGYYAVVSNRRLGAITTAPYLRRQNIGPENLVLLAHNPNIEKERLAELRRAIVENRQREGLYVIDESAVKFPSESLFRATIRFPANVPVGEYRILVRLFRNGEEIDRTSSLLTVGKRGLEQQIYTLAHTQPALYGLMAIFIAVSAGWLAAAIFRRS